METKTLIVTDSRIDNALETKPFDDVFELIEKYPEIMTLERLPKFIKRCSKDVKRKMRDYLDKRYNSHFCKDNSSCDFFWNKEIVLAMIDGGYFSDEYDYYKIVALVRKYDDGNAMQLAFKWFKNAAYSFQHDALYNLKFCFTSDYVQNRLKEGYYLEILTLVALRLCSMPQQLTKNQKRNLRKHMFEVLTVNYYEQNINSARTCREERVTRIKRLFAQCPDLFTIKDVVTIALTDQNLAKEIYDKMNPGHRIISQKTIGKLLDNKQCHEEMMLLILWYNISLDTNNVQKIYAWIKKIMSSHNIVHSNNNGWQDNQTVNLFRRLSSKYKITLQFDDFLDVLIKIGGKDVDIKGYNEIKIMTKFFDSYRKNLSRICDYKYRSGVNNKLKKKIILDLFFWKYLPWNTLHKEEKVALQEYIEMHAEKYPKEILLLAQTHPSIITLSDRVKFVIFIALAKKNRKNGNSKYVEFDFGPGINNEVVLCVQDFVNLVEKRIDDLYQIIQIPQIKFDIALSKTTEPAKFSVWWGKSVYMLILIQSGKYSPTKEEVLILLKTFSDSKVPNYYFTSAWEILSENIKPTDLELCVLENNKSSEEPKFNILSRLLEKKLLVLDEVLIERLISLYARTKKRYLIENISKFEISNATELSTQIENCKLEAILN